MVNHGVSRGCGACKLRRKKCDETWPACRRCSRTKLTCPGYLDSGTLLFRNRFLQKIPASSNLTLPDSSITDLSDEHFEQAALEVFLSEYVVIPADAQISRGFLHGIDRLLQNVRDDSGLVRAARLIALATVGNRLRRPALLSLTHKRYGGVLLGYRQSLSHDQDCISIESLYTAVLLGLYEIIASTETSAVNHVAHLRGVCAILKTSTSPIDLNNGVRVFQTGNALLLKSPLEGVMGGVSCVPVENAHVHALDSILVRFGRLFHEVEEMPRVDLLDDAKLSSLEETANALHIEFEDWRQYQPDGWTPRCVGVLPATANFNCPYFHPGAVESYPDLFIAAVWNTYRKSHIMLLDVWRRLALQRGELEILAYLQDQARILALQIVSSVPFHLTHDTEEYVRYCHFGGRPLPANRAVAGLLLLHPIYAAASCSVVSPSTRVFFANCLSWIGENMGIRQANLLAASVQSTVIQHNQSLLPPPLPFQDMSEGHVLIWASFMIQRI